MAVVEFLEDAAELAESISSAMTAADTPTPPSAGGNWMPVTVVNHTQFLLTPADSYFDSGRFQVAPSLIAPFKAFTFSVSATDNSILTGVTGAMAYTFSPKQGVTCRLGVGFSNPEIGGYKANVAFDADMNQAENSNPVLHPIHHPDDVRELHRRRQNRGAADDRLPRLVVAGRASGRHHRAADRSGKLIAVHPSLSPLAGRGTSRGCRRALASTLVSLVSAAAPAAAGV